MIICTGQQRERPHLDHQCECRSMKFTKLQFRLEEMIFEEMMAMISSSSLEGLEGSLLHEDVLQNDQTTDLLTSHIVDQHLTLVDTLPLLRTPVHHFCIG